MSLVVVRSREVRAMSLVVRWLGLATVQDLGRLGHMQWFER